MLISVSLAGCLWLSAATTAAAEEMGNRSFFLHTSMNERQRDFSSSFKADCMYSSRSYMRHYPYDCYSHTFVDAWDQFQNFFKEIGGDFRFTFDFVLYDKNFPFAKENQLWYLIAFLKELRTLVPDPNQILAKGKADGQVESFRAALEARVAPVRKEYAALMQRLQQARDMAEIYHRKTHPSRRRRGRHTHPFRNVPRAASAYNIITTRQFDN